MTGTGGATGAAPGARVVVDVGRVVLHGVPAGRAREAVAAFERALREQADAVGDGRGAPPAAGSRAGRTDPVAEVGRLAAVRVWERIGAAR